MGSVMGSVVGVVGSVVGSVESHGSDSTKPVQERERPIGGYT